MTEATRHYDFIGPKLPTNNISTTEINHYPEINPINLFVLKYTKEILAITTVGITAAAIYYSPYYRDLTKCMIEKRDLTSHSQCVKEIESVPFKTNKAIKQVTEYSSKTWQETANYIHQKGEEFSHIVTPKIEEFTTSFKKNTETSRGVITCAYDFIFEPDSWENCKPKNIKKRDQELKDQKAYAKSKTGKALNKLGYTYEDYKNFISEYNNIKKNIKTKFKNLI